MSKKDDRFMRMACNIGLESTINIRHGCVAVLNGKVVAQGFNNERCFSSDGLIRETWCCHAEIDTIRKLLYSVIGTKTKNISVLCNRDNTKSTRQWYKILSRVTLYIARLPSNSKDDCADDESSSSSSSSAPCVNCMLTLRSLGIKQIAYISKNREFVKCKPSEYHHTHITAGDRSICKKYQMKYMPDPDFVKIIH
jgi:deoxycytidylate deaminase